MEITALAFGSCGRAQVAHGHLGGRTWGVQLIPEGPFQESFSVGECWVVAYQAPSNALRLYDWMEITVQAFSLQGSAQVDLGHSRSLGRA